MAYRIDASLLEPCLFENAVEGTRCDVVAGLSCNSDTTRCSTVLKLSVTPLRSDKITTVIMEHPQHLTDFHRANIPRCEFGAKRDSLLRAHARHLPAWPNRLSRVHSELQRGRSRVPGRTGGYPTGPPTVPDVSNSL